MTGRQDASHVAGMGGRFEARCFVMADADYVRYITGTSLEEVVRFCRTSQENWTNIT